MNEILSALKSAMEAASADYEMHRGDSWMSYVYKNKMQILKDALIKVESGTPPDQLIRQYQEELAANLKAVKEEEQHPTFDWAGDHVWEMIYTGCADGCREILRILEEPGADRS